MWSRFFKLFELVFNFYGDLQKLKETSSSIASSYACWQNTRRAFTTNTKSKENVTRVSANVRLTGASLLPPTGNERLLNAKWSYCGAKISYCVKG